jgi:hypothetical protein
MPNRTLILLAAALLLGGCASREVSPDLLLEARDAIDLAVAAGAEDHAPLELGEARDWIGQAETAVEAGDAMATGFLVERAALQARLAVVRAEASKLRADLERRRDQYQSLRKELTDAYGDRVLEGSR